MSDSVNSFKINKGNDKEVGKYIISQYSSWLDNFKIFVQILAFLNLLVYLFIIAFGWNNNDSKTYYIVHSTFWIEIFFFLEIVFNFLTTYTDK
jgi:hypothetical protein